MKSVFSTVAFTVLASLLIFPVVFINYSEAADQKISISLVQEGWAPANASGFVVVTNNPDGPDKLEMKMKGLVPQEEYTVFLTFSATTGALPAQFLGVYKANRLGKAKFVVRTEVVDAYQATNEEFDKLEGPDDPNAVAEEDGISSAPGTGGLANGAVAYPLDWIRVYDADAGGNVFGKSDTIFGGPHIFSTSAPIQF